LGTNELELQERLTQVSRLATIGEMAAGIAHELNQPLTAISTYAQACGRLLDRTDPNIGDVRDALRQIASQAARAGAITHRLRSLARHTEGELRPTDPNALVREVQEHMHMDAALYGSQLRFHLAEGLPGVLVDSIQIQHVLLNLLRNALEALTEYPVAERHVVIQTGTPNDSEVEIRICDTGPGVSTEAATHMFEPFFTTKSRGTGLGLSISATIVATNKGRLIHYPNHPRGACFCLRLPRA
jgi:two-component system sensor kinase FixL